MKNACHLAIAKTAAACTALLWIWLGPNPSAVAAINAAANRTALGANRTLNWTAMGTLGINVGSSEPVAVSGSGTVNVSCQSTGVLAQTRQSLAGGTGDFGGNFSPGEPLCYTTGAPMTLSFGGKMLSSLGFNIQAEGLGAFTARMRFYSGESATGSLLGTRTATGNSSAANNGTAVFLGGISDSDSSDFRSVVIDLTAATSVPNRLAINNVSFHELQDPTGSAWASPTGNTTASIGANVIPNGSGTSYHFRYTTDATFASFLVTGSQVAPRSTASVVSGQSISGLISGATYYYQLVASNNGGSFFGPIQSFVQTSPLDLTFGTQGRVTTAIGSGEDVGQAVARQSDGKIVVAGYVSVGGKWDVAVARHLPDGSLDPSFGGDGIVTTAVGTDDDVAHAVAVQPDGRIVVVGYLNNGGNHDFLAVRYLGDGTPDPSFGVNGRVTTAIGTSHEVARAVAIQPDGRIIVAGDSIQGTNRAWAVVRYLANGALDTSFSGDGRATADIGTFDDFAHGIAVQDDGAIVVCGEGRTGSAWDVALMRFTAGGELDFTFGSGGKVTTAVFAANDQAKAVAIQPDGRIVVTGFGLSVGATAGDVIVARYLPRGVLDGSFGTGGVVTTNVQVDDYGFAVAVQPDGRIVVGGSSNNPTADFLALRYNANGTLDTTFDGDGRALVAIQPAADDVAYGVALDPEGGIVLAGRTAAPGGNDFAVVKLTGGLPRPGIWNLLGQTTTAGGGGQSLQISGQVNPAGLSTTVSIEYGTSAALGSTQTVGTFTGSSLQSFSATLYPSGLTLGTTYFYRIVATNENGTTTSAIQTLVYAPGAVDPNFGGGDGVTVTPAVVGGTPLAAFSNSVTRQSDGKLIVSGYVGTAVGSRDFALARYHADGTLDTSFGTGGIVITPVRTGDDFGATAVVQASGKIVVAGTVASPFDVGVVRYNSDGTLDASFGTGGKLILVLGTGDDYANSMMQLPDGRLVIVGTTFNTTTGNSDAYALRMSAEGVLDSSFGSSGIARVPLSSTLTDEFYTAALQPNGSLVLAGRRYVTTTQGDSVVVRLSANGTPDGTFGTGGVVQMDNGMGDLLYSVQVQSDGKIVACGFRETASGLDSVVIRLNANGVLDPTFNGTGKVITSAFNSSDDRLISLALQRDSRIVAVGRFLNGAAQEDMMIFRLNPDGTFDTTFDGDGIVTLAPGPSTDSLGSVLLQPDGQIVAAGRSVNAGGTSEFALVRLIGGPNDLIVNGGFESVEALGDGFATGFGDWRQDQASIVTAENGITPFAGTRMAKFVGTSPFGAGTSASGDLSQFVDLSSYATQIALGGVAVTVTARVNRVAGNASTDTEFRLMLLAQSQLPAAGPGSGGLGAAQSTLMTDGNPATWELITTTLVVPLGTTTLFVNPYAEENVLNNSAVPEFDGHYIDDVQMQVVLVPNITVEQPNGTGLTDGTSSVHFDTAPAGGSSTRTFTIRNDGAAVLTGLAATFLGGIESAFSAGFGATTLAPGESTTLTVTFSSIWVGLHNDTLRIASNDPDENPFDIALTAIGGGSFAPDFVTAGWVPITANGFTATGVTLGGVSLDFAPTPGLTLTLVNNTGTGAISGTFGGLPQGALVNAAFGGTSYPFRISYVGGTGNDIVLVYQSPGALDLTFNGTGRVIAFDQTASGVAQAVAIQQDGRVVVAGYAALVGPNRSEMMRYNADGSLDLSFGWLGVVTVSQGSGVDNITAMAIQPNGQIVVGGYAFSGTGNVFALMRFNPNGSVDNTFGGGGVSTAIGTGGAQINALAIQSDGKIVAVGSAGDGSAANIAVVRYTAGGVLDTSTFGGNPTTYVGGGITTIPVGAGGDFGFAVALQSDGRIVVAGEYDNGNYDICVVRLNTNGTLDTSFDGDGRAAMAVGTGHDYGRAVAVQRDGRIVVSGSAANAGGILDTMLARFTPAGAPDPTFGSAGKLITSVAATAEDASRAVLVQRDGRIISAGYTGDGTARDMVALRHLPDGTLDRDFGVNGIAQIGVGAADDVCFAAALQPDGRIVLAGRAMGANNDFAVVRLLGGPDDLLINGGFESPELLGGGVATGFGDWRQDQASIVTAENGITPFAGSRMAKFLGTAATGAAAATVDGDISQFVDLSAYSVAIAAGGVTATVTARVNRVAGTANTDTEFRLLLIARNQMPDTGPLAGQLANQTSAVFTDADPATWQTLTTTLVLPPGTTNLFVNPYARENVTDNGTAPEFDGHYIDDVRVILSGPPDFWFVQVFQDLAAYPTVTNVATAEALIASNARIAQGSMAQADLLGFSATLPAGRFPFDLPVPGTTGNRNNYAVKATAQFWVATAGNYTFAAHTDDGVRVRIDGQVVITDDGEQNARDSQYAVVNLTAGAHTIEWVWYEHLGEDEGELFAAPGVHTSFSSAFMPVGDARMFGLPAGIAPEVVVEQPALTNLVDGTSTVNFGTLAGPSTIATRIFTVRNTGTRQLTGLDFLLDGPDAARFSIVSRPVAPVLPGGSTTFTLQFAPGSAGPRAATLRMTSNDADENPFDIALAGNAFSSIEEWRNTYFGTTANTGNAANAADPDGDGDLNVMEFAYGTNPTVPDSGVIVVSGPIILQRGSPTVWLQNTLYGVDYRALFGRRKDYLVAGLTYTVQFSSNLTTWETSTATPTVIASDAVMDAVTVPYPFFLSTGAKAQFFRVVVTGP